MISACALSSCKNQNKSFESVFSFFVAGHTYGNPTSYQLGLHPPFLNHVESLNSHPNLELGVLTGDVVPIPTAPYWEAARTDIDQFSVPIHIAAGNHDRGEIFDSLYQDHYAFFKHQDLFIILSPTNWNIENEQKEFLLNALDNNAEIATNIFIFCHELIWWSPDSIFGNVDINFRPHYPGSTNYWSEIHPILDSLDNEVCLFAGDLGASEDVSPFMYYKDDNVRLIASGMGGGQQDNVIVTEVDATGQLNFLLLGLNGEGLREITDLTSYTLP